MVELTSRESYQHGRLSGLPPVARRSGGLHYNRQRIQLWGVAFVAPTLLFFAVFKYGPDAVGHRPQLHLATTWCPAPHFVGLGNYVSLVGTTRSSGRR